MDALTRNIVDMVRHPLLILDSGLRVVIANTSFYRTFGGTASGTEGHDLFKIGGGLWDHPRLRDLLEEVIAQDCSFADFELDQNDPDLGRRVMLLNGRRLVRNEDSTSMVILAIEDEANHRQERDDRQLLNADVERQTAELGAANSEFRDTNWELGASNRNLETFCYPALNDQSSPLQAGNGFHQERLPKDGDRPDCWASILNSRNRTETLATEEALRASEKRFQAAFEHTAVSMALTDTDCRFTRVNAAFARLFGYSAQEMLGLAMVDVTHPDDLAESRSFNTCGCC
jgi:PAS domain-containing protein